MSIECNRNPPDMNKQIQLVVFDWAGTITDYGSCAPVEVFNRTFSQHGVFFDRADINAPMGMEKMAHIRSMLFTQKGQALWTAAVGRAPEESDVEQLYHEFEALLATVVADYCTLIPGALKAVQELEAMGITIASTTGYTSEMMQLVSPLASAQGYTPSSVVTPDITGHSRPSPFMLFECMRRANVYPASRVVKVGDTLVDILEGKNAGAITVGLLTGSNLLSLTEQEYQATPEAVLAQLKQEARDKYLAAGADYVLDSISELPALISQLNQA